MEHAEDAIVMEIIERARRVAAALERCRVAVFGNLLFSNKRTGASFLRDRAVRRRRR
jgi:hypothetical protein